MGLPDGLITGRTARLPGLAGDLKKHPTGGDVPKSHTGYEVAFWRLWCSQFPDLPRPYHNHEFAWPDRKWQFDFAWPDAMVAVEIDGSAVGGGRHQRWKGWNADAEKLREATMRDWKVLRFTTDNLKAAPVQCIEAVAKMIKRK